MNNMNIESKTDEKPKEPSLEDKLVNKVKHGWEIFNDEQKKETLKLADEYFDFLKNARTERERTAWTVKKAEENGFKRVEIGKNINKLNPGEKIYYVNREKNVAMVIIGEKPIVEKNHLIGAHIDTPRLDLKMRPLYESGKSSLALFKTHYYGGIKKYQWATIPLHLTGLIVKKDGTKIPIEIGKNPDDPVFTIPDILPHLSKNVQAKRKMPEVLKGE